MLPLQASGLAIKSNKGLSVLPKSTNVELHHRSKCIIIIDSLKIQLKENISQN